MAKIKETLRVSVSVVACMLVFVFGANAQEDEEGVITLRTTVTGNQEQPKVLYIVPWKDASDDSALVQPLESQLQEIFKHVDRSEHQREVNYRLQMKEKEVTQ